MNELRLSGWCAIFFTLFIAFILMVLPLPHWASDFRPPWVLLVVLFWVMALPHRVGIFIAWICGLILDNIQGTLLGENALCFAILAYIVFKIHRQIRLVSIPFKMLMILVILFINQSLLFWFQGLQGQLVSLKWFLGSPFVGAILWPWILMILTDSIKRFRLH